MPKITKAEANERNEGRGATMAAALLEIATPRAISPADLFCSLAAMVMRQNPNLGAKLLGALELSVRQHPEADVYGGPLGNVTETAEAGVTETVEPRPAFMEAMEAFGSEESVAQLAPGCCSASSPCNHQKAEYWTICAACQAAKDAAALNLSAIAAGLPQYCPSPSGDGVCPSPMACKVGCEREFAGVEQIPARVEPPADVAFEAPANAANAA